MMGSITGHNPMIQLSPKDANWKVALTNPVHYAKNVMYTYALRKTETVFIVTNICQMLCVRFSQCCVYAGVTMVEP